MGNDKLLRFQTDRMYVHQKTTFLVDTEDIYEHLMLKMLPFPHATVLSLASTQHFGNLFQYGPTFDRIESISSCKSSMGATVLKGLQVTHAATFLKQLMLKKAFALRIEHTVCYLVRTSYVRSSVPVKSTFSICLLFAKTPQNVPKLRRR